MESVGGYGLLFTGISHIVLFLVFWPLNGFIVFLIYRNKHIWKLTAYKIVLHITVVIIVILPATLLLGILNLTEKYDIFPRTVIAASTVLCYYSPPLLCAMMAVQAFNRFVVISRFGFLDKGLIFQVALCVSWVLITIFAVEMVSRGVEFTYDKPLHIYFIHNEEPEGTMLFVFSVFCLSFGALFFTASLVNVVVLNPPQGIPSSHLEKEEGREGVQDSHVLRHPRS
uniref:G_PROTEIN_RECEP_F1_2 domain-containing protein n=1 Tax=Steinernema glaseri TaxID=37863 RepID=A0A1I7ZSI2_9BILA